MTQGNPTSWTPIGKARKSTAEIPINPKMESAWLKRMLDGELEPARRVIIQLHCQDRAKARRHLMSFEITRFHEDEAFTNKRWITERGTDDRGIIYCRLTALGHELERIFYSPSGQREWEKHKRKQAGEKIVDAILG